MAAVSAGCAIGVDLGGTKLLAGVLGEDLERGATERRVISGLALPGLLDALASVVERLREAAPAPVVAVGLGVAALVRPEDGVVVQSTHLPIVGARFGDLLAERVGVPVVVDNDGNTAALAEARLGAARRARHALLLTLGTGVGGGLVLDGSLYRGAGGVAGELGHLVVDEDGPPCFGSCPSRGCLEALVSGSAVARDAAAAVSVRPASALAAAVREGAPLDGELVTRLALEGEPESLALVREVGRRLGAGLAGLVNALNPEVVVVGGGVMAAGELLLEPARAELAARGLLPAREQVRVVAAEFGAQAGMLGAALMALDAAEAA